MCTTIRKNILLIGAGQLGSRHLQALALMKKPCNIFVVDPNSDSISTTNQRFESINGHQRHKLHYCDGIHEIPGDNFDLCIIATNADIRTHVIKKLLANKRVSHIILEKVLFQSIDDYSEIDILLQKYNVVAYVNCPRRMNNFYNEMKMELLGAKKVQIEMIGNNWGLACNGIHLIDLYNFLTGDIITHWQNNLDKDLVTSKRAGFIEFFGNISGQSDKGNSLSLTCFNTGSPNWSIRISTPNIRITIEEGLGKAWLARQDKEWEVKEILFTIPYQSQLTQKVAEQVFEKGTCQLTPYMISSALHVPFIQVLLNHYNKYQVIKTKLCPIT